MQNDVKISKPLLWQAGWLPARRASLQLIITRQEGEEEEEVDLTLNQAKGCHAKLAVGTLHDDYLLVFESMSIDTFASPYTVKFSTQVIPEGMSLGLSVVTNVYFA